MLLTSLPLPEKKKTPDSCELPRACPYLCFQNVFQVVWGIGSHIDLEADGKQCVGCNWGEKS